MSTGSFSICFVNYFYAVSIWFLRFVFSSESQKRPQVRCDNEKIARVVVQQVNYARGMYEEMTQAVIQDFDSEET
jgi:hypothetical protein